MLSAAETAGAPAAKSKAKVARKVVISTAHAAAALYFAAYKAMLAVVQNSLTRSSAQPVSPKAASSLAKKLMTALLREPQFCTRTPSRSQQNMGCVVAAPCKKRKNGTPRRSQQGNASLQIFYIVWICFLFPCSCPCVPTWLRGAREASFEKALQRAGSSTVILFVVKR